jgi:hypothetical protein
VQVSDLLVEVRDRALRRVAQISPESLDLSFTLRDSAVGEWQLRLPAEHPAVAHLRVPGAGIVVTGPDGVLLSGPTSTPTVDADLADPTGIATVEGVTDDALLWSRLAYPTPSVGDVSRQTQGYDVRTGPAESVMLGYVQANLRPSTPSPRSVEALVVPASRGRGDFVTKSARFDVLGDLLRQIASGAALRFRVVQAGDSLVFEVLDVTDRRRTVRFDLVNGTLSSQQVATSPPALTRAIVGGQGEGAERLLVEEHTAASAEAETLYGPWGRVERFVDERGAADPRELAQAGQKLLGEQGSIATAVKAVASDDLTMRFAVDWQVGDRVTVVVGGQETESTVTAVTVIAREAGVLVGAALGDVDGFDPRGALGRRVEDTASRVSSLERTAESGGAFEVDGEVLRFRPRADAPATAIPTLSYLTRTGKVAPLYTQGPPRVVWDDDGTEAGPYAHLGNGWRPCAGEEVLGTRNTRSGAWVVSPVAWGTGHVPNWHPLTLQNGWSPYGSGYATPSFTRTALGLVKVKGLIRSSSPAATVIAQLPVGFRPSGLFMAQSQIGAGGGSSGSLDVRPDGSIVTRGYDGAWTSLDSISFWAADSVPDSAWTPVALANGFQNFVDVSGGGWQRAAYYRDPFGIVWERGLLTRAAGVPAANTAAFTTPHWPQHTQHRRVTANSTHAYWYKRPGGATSWGAGVGTSYVSLDGMPWADAQGGPEWNALTTVNTWTNYDTTGAYSPIGWARTAEGLVLLRGLVKGGTFATQIAQLPVGVRPAERLLMGTVSNQSTARVDIAPDGQIIAQTGSSSWFSLDGIHFIAEQ